MMSVAKTTKDLAKKIARQVAREPGEVIKTAEKQITGGEVQAPKVEGKAPIEVPEAQKEKLEIQRQRMITALQNELKDIQKKGEEKKVEAEKAEELKEEKKKEKPAGLPQVSTKPGRRLVGWGLKKKQLQTQVETRQPSST